MILIACHRCQGTGHDPELTAGDCCGHSLRCQACHGRGYVMQLERGETEGWAGEAVPAAAGSR